VIMMLFIGGCFPEFETGGFFGLLFLLVSVAAGVGLFVSCGMQNAPYQFLDQNTPFDLEYGVRGLVTEKQKAFRPSYIRQNIIAVCLCVLSPIVLLLGAFSQQEQILVAMLCLMLALVGVAVYLFIAAGVRMASMQKLLREGEWSQDEKRKGGLREVVGTAYWLLATAIYLGWSFLCNLWQITWVVFAVAGILFPAVMGICNLIGDQCNKEK